MRALQTMLPTIPATVFLGEDRRSILFVKQSNKNFIDYTDGNDMAAWIADALCIGSKVYAYNAWHEIDETLKNYFRELLRDSLENV